MSYRFINHHRGFFVIDRRACYRSCARLGDFAVSSALCDARGPTRHFQLPIFSASPTKPAVNRAGRSLLRLLALVWLTLGMSVPASAWTVHEAAHGAAQVSVDAHHHHDDDGGVSVHDHDDGDAPDGGHYHMPSILLGAATVPDWGVTLAVPELARMVYILPASAGVERSSTDALRRPPRLA